MSLYGAMYSGVSGLTAESSALSAISDNITNVNTVGYKETDVNFQTLVTQQESSTSYSPGGVQSKPRANVEVQGLLQSTSSSTDVAISGQGFFIVNSNNNNTEGSFAYTRAGSFSVDSNGNLSNTSGYVLQGWPLTTWDSTPSAAHQTINGQNYMAAYKNGLGNYVYINESSQPNPTDLQPLNLNDIAGTAQATTSISMGANLPSGSAAGVTEQTSAQIYDSLGDSSNINMTWTAGSVQNTWSLEADPPAGARTLVMHDNSATNAAVYSAIGRLDFNDLPSAGSLTLPLQGTTYTFNFVTPAPANTPTTWNIDPTTAGSLTNFTAELATDMQAAYEIANGTTVSLNTSAGAMAYGGVNDALTIGTTTINLAGASNETTAIAAINAKTGSTGVTAMDNGAGNILLYSNTNKSQTITGAGNFNAPVPNPATVVGTGDTYVNQVAGSNSLLFRQNDPANQMVLQGLTSVLDSKGSYSIQQTNINQVGLTAAQITTQANQIVLPTIATAVYSGTDKTVVTPGTPAPAVTFNGNGTPSAINVGQISVTWANGSEDMTTAGSSTAGAPISLKLGDTNTSDGMTQLSGSYELSFMTANGAKFGNFSGVTVGADGIVTASFSNGVTQPIFQIPLATFIDPDGLTSLTGNVFLASTNSGSPTVRTAGNAGAGATTGGSLESSTVDIGTQFTQMIVTQRAYSAASKVITTANQMLDDLMQVVR